MKHIAINPATLAGLVLGVCLGILRNAESQPTAQANPSPQPSIAAQTAAADTALIEDLNHRGTAHEAG